jgi:hypothetical protein
LLRALRRRARRREARLARSEHRRARAGRQFRAFQLEGLEPRILLSADLPISEVQLADDDSSSLIQQPAALFEESTVVIDMSATGRELTLRLDPLAQTLLVLDSSDPARPAFAQLSTDKVEQIVVRGTDLDDHLTVDLGPGQAPAVHFDGGFQESPDSGGDVLSFSGKSNATSVRFTGADETGFSGEIEADGTIVSFTGLEPVETSATADLHITLPVDASNPDAELRNISGRPGWSELVGSSFENHAFENPTNSLTIVLGDLGDSLTLTSLDPAFAALITVTGGAGTDTLTGPNAASGWVLMGTDRGRFGSPGTFVPTTFFGVESIRGGADVDTLDVSTGRLTGGFDGGGGADRVTATADADFDLSAAQLSVNGRTTGLQSVSAAVLTGGASDNVFEALDFEGTVELDGGGGEDFFTVRPGDGSAVSVAGGAHDDRILILGTGGADVFAVSENGVSFSVRSVGLVDIERLDVYGRGGADAFNVTPSTSVAMHVDGGGDADELRIDAQGRDIILDDTAPIVAGQVKIAGFLPVTYGDTEDVFVLDTDLANGHGPARRSVCGDRSARGSDAGRSGGRNAQRRHPAHGPAGRPLLPGGRQ